MIATRDLIKGDSRDDMINSMVEAVIKYQAFKIILIAEAHFYEVDKELTKDQVLELIKTRSYESGVLESHYEK